MADGVFNIAKGMVNYYATLPAANDALVLVLLQSSGIEADATLQDYDTLAAILASTNTEATFTNYSRTNLSSVTSTVDDTNNRRDTDAADVTLSSAGGASNNTIAKAVICYDPDTTTGTDSDLIPLTHHDASFTTDGTDQTLSFGDGYIYRAN